MTRILLVRLRLIGDVVFTTPAIRAIKRHIDDAHLTYLVEAEAVPVVAGNPHLDEVLVVGRARGLERIREDLTLAKRLRAARFDVAIDFHGGPRSSWLTWLTSAPVRIGYDIAYRRWWYTVRVHRATELRARHSVVNQWDLLAPLGPAFLVPPEPSRDPVEMAEVPLAAARVSRWMADVGIRTTDRPIVVHVSAGNLFRRWPEAQFVELVGRLAAGHPDRCVILTAGPSDVAAARRVGRAARARLPHDGAGAILDADHLDLTELHALLARSALFVGGDSGPLHLAATTRVPIVGLYGPTLPARSAPWRDPTAFTESLDVGTLPCRPCDQRSCEPGDFRCLTTLGAPMVIQAAERVLAAAHRS